MNDPTAPPEIHLGRLSLMLALVCLLTVLAILRAPLPFLIAPLVLIGGVAMACEAAQEPQGTLPRRRRRRSF